jgi:hypothetical protein
MGAVWREGIVVWWDFLGRDGLGSWDVVAAQIWCGNRVGVLSGVRTVVFLGNEEVRWTGVGFVVLMLELKMQATSPTTEVLRYSALFSARPVRSPPNHTTL